MIDITTSGDHNRTRNALERILKGNIFSDLDMYGRMGVDALSQVTPIDSGLTSQSWKYRIVKDRNRTGIEWYNTNKVNNIPVVILLQYGHGTGTGGYVAGYDFINPAMRPIFDQIADNVWKKVKL